MSGETVITVVGNLTGDLELRSTQAGRSVANFTVASTARVYDRARNEWVDAEDTLFLRCTLWGKYADHAAASLRKGQQVIVVGNLTQRSYEVDGSTRIAYELVVHDVGPSLRFAIATVARAARATGSDFVPDDDAGVLDPATGELVGA